MSQQILNPVGTVNSNKDDDSGSFVSQTESDLLVAYTLETNKTDQLITNANTNTNNQRRKATAENPTSINNITSHSKDLSQPSQLSQTSKHLPINGTREIVEEFFYDNGRPYRPPTPHMLDESPCKSIISITNDNFYYCKMHPDTQNIYLESIEHHIKYISSKF